MVMDVKRFTTFKNCHVNTFLSDNWDIRVAVVSSLVSFEPRETGQGQLWTPMQYCNSPPS